MEEDIRNLILAYEKKVGSDWFNHIAKAQSKEELISILKKDEFFLTPEQAEYAFNYLLNNRQDELSESELMFISGGGTSQQTSPNRNLACPMYHNCSMSSCLECPNAHGSGGK